MYYSINMKKTITIKKKTWVMLIQDKIDLDLRTIDDVINHYKDIIIKIKGGNKNDKTTI